MTLSVPILSTKTIDPTGAFRSSRTEALIRGGLAGAGLLIALGLFIALGRGARLHAPDLNLLRAQSPVILAHTGAAILALIVGALLMSGRKGNAAHRILGWGWAAAMAVVVVSSFLFAFMKGLGVSPIHGLSAFVSLSVPAAVIAARRGQIAAHRKTMTGVFLFGLVVAGAFTFVPGRLMWRIFFG